jgi:hypothetical protein
MPVVKYAVPAAGSGAYVIGPDSGPIDWWVSRNGNAVYDDVRFAADWQDYIYSIPAAKAGPCTVSPNLPKGGLLPWVQADRKVVEIRGSGKPFAFGSFIAIQHAGGTYALMSGHWGGTTTPYFHNEGDGELVTQDDHWIIEPNRAGGPRIGLYRKGRAEYSARLNRLSSRVHLVSRIALSSSKEIRFPDDSRVKLNFFPGNCDRELCNGLGSSSILAYDIENNDTEAKKGTLDAKATVAFVDASIADPGSGPGLTLDGSYGKTGDHKTLNITGPQSALMLLDPRKRYRMRYGINFDLWTEGRGTNASDFWYRALVAPAAIYLTKGN